MVGQIRNVNNVLAGAEPLEAFEFALSDSGRAYLRQYAFSLPDGDILLAAWRNGNAEEQDAGVGGRIIIPGFQPNL